MKNYHFEPHEVPYGTLNQFGLTQEMIEDLPVDVLEDILDGRPSPVLPVVIPMEDGDKIQGRTRFSLLRGSNGNPEVLFYPKLNEYQLNAFSEEEQKNLIANKAIIGTIGYNNEKGIQSFIQLDSETKQVLSVPTPVIARNLQMIADNAHLVANEIQALKNGQTLTFMDKNQTVTLGIDLTSKSGLRFSAGDEETWQKESKREWDKYTFGAFGCWVMGDDGNLDYVHEDDYTEELWNEQKKLGVKMSHGR